MKNIKSTFSLFFYYLFLKYLPSNSLCSVCVRLRAYVAKYIFDRVGSNLNIASGVRFGKGAKISIGNNSGIGENCYLVAMDHIYIGDNVMIGPEVMILTGGHDYNDPTKSLIAQNIITKPVVIGNDCWISARVTILPGISICDRVIIAAGSIVSKSISESGIYGGNPARKIKDIPS